MPLPFVSSIFSISTGKNSNSFKKHLLYGPSLSLSPACHLILRTNFALTLSTSCLSMQPWCYSWCPQTPSLQPSPGRKLIHCLIPTLINISFPITPWMIACCLLLPTRFPFRVTVTCYHAAVKVSAGFSHFLFYSKLLTGEDRLSSSAMHGPSHSALGDGILDRKQGSLVKYITKINWSKSDDIGLCPKSLTTLLILKNDLHTSFSTSFFICQKRELELM